MQSATSAVSPGRLWNAMHWPLQLCRRGQNSGVQTCMRYFCNAKAWADLLSVSAVWHHCPDHISRHHDTRGGQA